MSYKIDLNFEGSNLPGIYLILRKSDNMPYIGQTSLSIKQRLEQHIANKYVSDESSGIDAAIKREGADKFEYKVLLPIPDASIEQLWFFEAMYIDRYDSKNKGFNKTIGNHVGAFDLVDYRNKHRVEIKLTKSLEREYRICFKNKRILLIGNFCAKFISYLEYNECDIINIDKYTEDDKEFLAHYYEEIDKLENKDFDIIISNPPYGKVGREITHNIIDNINYRQFINLLPANDYARDKDLFKYVDIKSMKPINNGFKDAAVTTHMALINKKPCLYISKEEFEIENYIDDSLKKYFYENTKRTHYAFDKSTYTNTKIEIFNSTNNLVSYIQGAKDVNHKHLPYTKDCVQYKWNIEKSIDSTYIKNNCECKLNGIPCGATSLYLTIFNSSIEKDNFVKFMYSSNGFKFMCKVFTAMNVDSYITFNKFMPKVDWTREWTVEEILADYGYIEKEIKEVMDDLVNFKDMER